MEILRITRLGLGLTIQDAGRPGWRRFGVPVSGVMDSFSASAANRLVGNDKHEAVIEWCLHGAEFEILTKCRLALAGADTGGMNWTAQEFQKGDRLKISGGKWGNWGYLSVSGGWHSPIAFGSRSYYQRGEIGEELKIGDVLSAEPELIDKRIGSQRVIRSLQRDFPEKLQLPIQPSCQFSLFSEEQRKEFVKQEWKISSRSDRTGYRLEGAISGIIPEIQSEAVLPGSIQITTGGHPIVVMPDGPTVGGYPKIGYLQKDQREALAQARAGTPITFHFQSGEMNLQ